MKRGGRRAAERRPPSSGIGELALWLLVVVPPIVFLPSAEESFRLPKLMVAEWLGLASLLALAFRLRAVPAVRWAEGGGLPARRARAAAVAVAPLVVVALAGLALSRHPLHVRQGLADLAIGAACLAGWSLGLAAERLRRFLDLMLWPAAALALFAVLQFHGIFAPLRFVGLAAGSRLAVTSLAGNPGDLAAYLVLPCLLAQWRLAGGGSRSGRRWPFALSLALSLYALAATETLAAFAAVGLGTVVLWGMRLPGHRRRAAALSAAGAVAVALLLVAAVAPLRARLAAKTIELRSGDWNAVLSGRLDGWRAAAFLLAEHPLAGVGQGAFRAEFAPAKLALLDRGVAFYPNQPNASFANAHNELLEVGADLGWPGLAALAWGIGLLWLALRRLPAGERDGRAPAGSAALAWAGTAALAVLAVAQFPFRVALVGFPALLFLAWVFRAAAEVEPAADDGRVTEPAAAPAAGRGAVPGRALSWTVAALLAVALLGQTRRAERRIAAGRLLGTVETLSFAAASTGRAPAGLLAANLEALDRAAALDPVEVEILVARGGQFLYFGRPEASLEPYGRALALEPHPEIYLDLARAYLVLGDAARARANLDLALRLSPWLRPQAPPGLSS
jgi:O-antigen ligase